MYIYEEKSVEYCWQLFILDVWIPKNITTFEEKLPAYIDASPPASSMLRQHVNATATWLLDGLNFSQTTNFIEQDGRMIILSTPRHLNVKNVTYRIAEDNGHVHDVNLTLMVVYGPYSPLRFSPSEISCYIVTIGDVLPDITCSTDRSGVGNVLSLGKMDKSSKGLYTCQATRNGTDHVVERSLYVEVNDETSFIIAVSVLGTMNVITLTLLCVCTLCWYRTSCLKGTIARTVEKMQNRTTTQHIQETNISTVEVGHYVGLDRSRNTEPGTQQTYESLELEIVAGPM